MGFRIAQKQVSEFLAQIVETPRLDDSGRVIIDPNTWHTNYQYDPADRLVAIEDATGMNVLLLPIGACDDMAHSQNEKYNISNLVNGIKVRKSMADICLFSILR